MTLLKKNYLTILIWVLLIGLFLGTRLLNLLNLPIYVDEPLYVRRALATLDGDIFFGLRQSLKPVYVWLAALTFLVTDYHWLALRVISVLAGLLTLPICYLLANKLYGPPLGYLATLIYLLSPFALFFNRLGITDSLLTLFMGLTILMSVYLWEKPSSLRALGLGLIIAIATLTKTYGFLYGVTPLLLWVLVEKRSSWFDFSKYMAIAGLTTGLLAGLPILSIGAQSFETESTRRAVYAAELETSLMGLLWQNTQQAIEWLNAYLTFPIFILFLITAIFAIRQRDRIGCVLLILVAILVAFFILISTDWHSRYLLPVLVPISILGAKGLTTIRWMHPPSTARPAIALSLALLLLLSLPAFVLNYHLLTKPQQADIPQRDKIRYVDGGFGLGAGLAYGADLITARLADYETIKLITGPERSKWTIYTKMALPQPQIVYQDVGKLDTLTPTWLNQQAQQMPVMTLMARITSIYGDTPLILEGDTLRPFDHPSLWQLGSYPLRPRPDWEWRVDTYQWLLPPDFARHWLQQGGDSAPQVAWYPTYDPPPYLDGQLIDARTVEATTAAELVDAGVEYLLLTPDWVANSPPLQQFFAIDGTQLQTKQPPPDWRLAYAHPSLTCELCLWQLRPPTQPTRLTFDSTIRLEGYDLAVTAEAVHLTLHWHNVATRPENLTVFVHLTTAAGEIVAQSDAPPFRGLYPTSQWQPGIRLADRHTLTRPLDLTAGAYRLRIGLYDSVTVERLTVQADDGLVAIADDAVWLAEVALE